MTPNSMNIEKAAYGVIEFCISYTLRGTHELAYEIMFENERKIIMYMTVHVLPKDRHILLPLAHRNPEKHESDFFYELHPVCVADADPPLQIFWICNSYDVPVSFSVEFTTSNPAFSIKQNSGTVQPLSVYPVVIMFKPYQLQLEQIILLLHTGDFVTQLLIIGEVTISSAPLSSAFRHLARRQLRCGYLPSHVPIILSETRINIVSHSHSKRDVVLHMENTSDKCVQYEWSNYILNGILCIQVEPCKGYISSFRTITVRIHLISEGPACIVNVPIECQVKVMEHPVVWQTTGWFTITEEGYSEPIPPSPPPEIEYCLSLDICARVARCCTADNSLLMSYSFHYFPLLSQHDNCTQVPPLSDNNLGSEKELKPEVKNFMLCELFDRILWDVVWCKLFEKNLEALAEENVPEYSQIKSINSKDSRHESQYLSLVIQELLYDSLHAAVESSSVSTSLIRYTSSNETCLTLPDIYSSSDTSELSGKSDGDQEEHSGQNRISGMDNN
ncbi:uncharacterized protein LOC113384089 [Ctenocephalides felis]|uniref:uncharacterized protein LOC113384089 n=1 Tax=Ctenocephalides felis TaxID=7515 RepID=UPI000E6E56E8|nr:uncharacterized protein LOC113384089 [Ctenocephalides felis]